MSTISRAAQGIWQLTGFDGSPDSWSLVDAAAGYREMITPTGI